MAAAISVVTFGGGTNSKVLQTNNNSNRDIIIVRKTNKKIKKEPNRVSNPTPIAVARRNARERNRVKQVNNGFATLRQHIPPEIAASFETNGRSTTNKKLSKVETLRMAVEYIRSLEEILSGTQNTSEDLTAYPSSPPLSTSSSNFIYPETSSPYPQYIRIQGNDTYHVISNGYTYEDEENIQPMVDPNTDMYIDSPPLPDMTFDDANYLSPYSDTDHSLSPTVSSNVLPPIVVFQPSRTRFNSPRLLSPDELSLHQSSIQAPVITSNDIINSSVLYSPTSDDCNTIIKTEVPDDLTLSQGVIKTEEMVDVMDWWNNCGGKYPKEEDS